MGAAGSDQKSWKYNEALAMSLYSHWRYYGYPKPGSSVEQMVADMRQFGIEYFLVWGSTYLGKLPRDWPELAQGKAGSWSVYRVGPTE